MCANRLQYRSPANSGQIRQPSVLFRLPWLPPPGFLCFWLLFLNFGRVAAIDTHFTQHLDYSPGFTLTAWRQDPTTVHANNRVVQLRRDGFMRLRFFILRYEEISEDSGATADVIKWNAQIRWGPTGAAMALSGVGVVALMFLCRQLSRSSRCDRD